MSEKIGDDLSSSHSISDQPLEDVESVGGKTEQSHTFQLCRCDDRAAGRVKSDYSMLDHQSIPAKIYDCGDICPIIRHLGSMTWYQPQFLKL